jgi:hypothetical protein
MIGMSRSEGGVQRAKTGESAAGASSRMHAESALKKGDVGGCCKGGVASFVRGQGRRLQ